MKSKLLLRAAKALYHGSGKSLPLGTILSPRKRGYVQSKDPEVVRTEAILERNRPAGSIPRAESVFMTEDIHSIFYMGGQIDFVYRVEPIGPTESNALAWHSELEMYSWDDESDPEAVRLAQGYWSGKLMPGARSNHIELRAKSAKVLSRVRDGARDYYGLSE